MTELMRIAVADDDPRMLQYFRRTLPYLGHEVVVAARNGRELIEQCCAAHPDLVITDISMPDMDGLEAVAAIYEEELIPVIVVSAYHDAEKIARAEKNHVLAYLVKPIMAEDLKTAIAVVMARFAQFQELRREAFGLQQAFKDRRLVERAKRILMRRANLSERDAFQRLQELSQEKDLTLIETARIIMEAEEAFRPL